MCCSRSSPLEPKISRQRKWTVIQISRLFIRTKALGRLFPHASNITRRLLLLLTGMWFECGTVTNPIHVGVAGGAVVAGGRPARIQEAALVALPCAIGASRGKCCSWLCWSVPRLTDPRTEAGLFTRGGFRALAANIQWSVTYPDVSTNAVCNGSVSPRRSSTKQGRCRAGPGPGSMNSVFYSAQLIQRIDRPRRRRRGGARSGQQYKIQAFRGFFSLTPACYEQPRPAGYGPAPRPSS
jgi:hypothetical protein